MSKTKQLKVETKEKRKDYFNAKSKGLRLKERIITNFDKRLRNPNCYAMIGPITDTGVSQNLDAPRLGSSKKSANIIVSSR